MQALRLTSHNALAKYNGGRSISVISYHGANNTLRRGIARALKAMLWHKQDEKKNSVDFGA